MPELLRVIEISASALRSSIFDYRVYHTKSGRYMPRHFVDLRCAVGLLWPQSNIFYTVHVDAEKVLILDHCHPALVIDNTIPFTTTRETWITTLRFRDWIDSEGTVWYILLINFDCRHIVVRVARRISLLTCTSDTQALATWAENITCTLILHSGWFANLRIVPTIRSSRWSSQSIAICI